MGLNLAEAGSADLAGASRRSRAYPWAVFALVLGLLLSDYMSRQVLSAVFPQLKAEWTLTDEQLGSLSGVVALMVGLLTMPLSLLADRRGRARSIALMAVVWSIATLCCGFAANYGQMLAARFFVGVGEAAYGSVGLAVIMSVFPPKVRATLAGAFTSAGIFGAVLGTALGGSVATHYGWRAAFSVMAVVGLFVTAVFSLTVTERRLARHIHPGAAVRTGPGLSVWDTLRSVFGSRALICAYLGGGLQSFALYSLLAWMPSYLNRYYGMAPGKAAMSAAGMFVLSGIGMTLCGVLTDWAGRSAPARKVSFGIGFCLLSCGVLSVAFRLPAGHAQIILIAVGALVAAGPWGPAGASVANLANPVVHATALALLALAYNLIGAAPGPFITGVLADRVGLLGALQLAQLVSIPAAMAFALCRRTYLRDLPDAAPR